MKNNYKRYLFIAAIIIAVLAFILFYKWQSDKKNDALLYETITKAGEITIADLESGEYYYTEENMFDALARWNEDEKTELPKDIEWKYHFWFKRGDRIVEVLIAKTDYYAINGNCFRINEQLKRDELYTQIETLIELSTEGYNCTDSYWCTSLCEEGK
ncbi:MAG: hypothetical protein IJI42_11830 [Methanobrevibacter sp.]|nr:hypothetical protein [Methanobrevibacter sp.]